MLLKVFIINKLIIQKGKIKLIKRSYEFDLLGSKSNHKVWEGDICHWDHFCWYIFEALSH